MAPDEDNSGVRVFPPGLFALALLLGLGLQWLAPLRLAPVALLFPVRVFGAVLVGDGFLLLAWASAMFSRAGTPRNPTKPTTALTFEGPYRLSRNPMYLGMGLILV